KHMLVENNTISYNNIEHFALTWDGAGAKFVTASDLVARNNLIESNYATGLWLDVSSTNAMIVNNTSRGNAGIGIFFEISHRALIAGNVAYNNNVGIMLSNSSSSRVYNNTLVNNSANFVVKDTQRNNTNAAEIAAGITWIARNNVFENNILSNARGSTLFDASNCDTKEPSAL
ncbi:right-handed parallel beta-helix repeat-containing protein, partial [Leptospira interrogans]|uniref:right-handed parallel beta-helix repeat-containing protein n=1 Tax=Leptospira interrogans TaxID=173 RepID=UPI00188A2FD4